MAVAKKKATKKKVAPKDPTPYVVVSSDTYHEQVVGSRCGARECIGDTLEATIQAVRDCMGDSEVYVFTPVKIVKVREIEMSKMMGNVPVEIIGGK